MFKSGNLDQKINSIKLWYPQEIKRNYFKTYYMSEFENGTSFIYSSFFESDDDKDELCGMTLVFVLNSEID